MTFPAARITDMTVHGGVITVGTPLTLIGNMPAARMGDLHTCALLSPNPHIGGPIILGAFNVLVGGPPQSRSLDACICVGPPDMVALGHFTTLVGMSGAFAGGIGGFLGLVVGGFAAGLQNLLGGYPRAVRRLDGTVVTEFSPNITIEGSPEYQAQVIADLNSPRNRDVVNAINNGNHHTTIRPVPAGSDQANASAWRTSDALLNPDGTRNSGCDTTIDYNPSLSSDYRGEDGNIHTMPPEDTLGHELIHAHHNDRGENLRNHPDTAPGGDNMEEARTIGVHGHENEPISERRMAEADGRSPRPDHDSIEGSTYQDTDGRWYRDGTDAGGNPTHTEIPAPNNRPNH
jgi:uncharacterized Zn-binding protein involved in type VI secretion